jgi:hypothetical protein
LPQLTVTDRKLRLFGCGCCRGRTGGLSDPRSRRAVEIAERYADGEAAVPERDMAYRDAHLVPMSATPSIEMAAAECLNPDTRVAANRVRMCMGTLSGVQDDIVAGLLRCVFGNPWESLHFSCMKCGKPTEGRRGLCGHGGPEGVCQGTGVLALPSWLTRCPRCCGRKHKVVSSEGTAVPCAACRGRGSVALWLTDHAHGIAQDAYDSRDWGLLPILADALEDAGCPTRVCPRCFGEPERCPDCVGQPDGCHPKPDCWVPHPILAHLRSPGPHARGCHVLDLILGKS